MTDSLKSLLMDPLTDLHDSIVLHLDDHSALEVLGEDLNQLRSSGTGKSLVMLALLNDLLRITEIVLEGQNRDLDPRFAEYAAPFFQTAAKTFSRKGLAHYAGFVHLTASDADRFLQFHAESGRPFGGRHISTQWSGLAICANVARKYANQATITGYDRLTRSLLSALRERLPRIPEENFRQLADFLHDRVEDVRDQLNANASPNDSLNARIVAELREQQAELDKREKIVSERERLIDQEWERFCQERAEFERVRQEWEERSAEVPPASSEQERIANERETLAIEKASLDHKRQELEQLQKELEAAREASGDADEEHATLAEARREIDRERNALTQQRRELESLRRKIMLESGAGEDASHVLFETEAAESEDRGAGMIKSIDANRLLQEAIVQENLEQLQAALGWGADLNRVFSEHDGKTSLHLAAKSGNEHIVQALLDAGADAGQTDAESLNALETAIINEQPEAARVLASLCPEAVAGAYPLLRKIMRDPKSPALTRTLCVEAIAYRGAEAGDAVPILLNLLESDDRQLGRAAAEALYQIQPASVVSDAIPYVTEILQGPLVKQQSADAAWVSKLYAVRGDLARLSGAVSHAQRDYEAALTLAPPDHQTDLKHELDNLESAASNSTAAT